MNVEVDLPSDLAVALDAALAGQPDQSREDIMRLALRQWLLDNGHLLTGDEGLRPEELNTENDG